MIRTKPTDGWKLFSQKLAHTVHRGAHQCFKHEKTGTFMVLCWWGMGSVAGKKVDNPSWTWLLLHSPIDTKLPDGRISRKYRENMSSPDDPPFSWASNILTQSLGTEYRE